MTAASHRHASAAWITAAACVPPLVLRAALILEVGGGPAWQDLAGAASDLAVSLVLCALLIGSAVFSRPLALLWLPIWTLLNYANYENALALNSLASLRDVNFLADLTFFRGSALWISSPWLLIATLAAATGLGWLGLRTRPSSRDRREALGACALAAALLIVGAVATSGNLAVGWRHTNFVQHNAAQLLIGRGTGPSQQVADPARAMAQRLPELLADLEGEPVVELPRPGRNVILVLLESISGAYLPRMAARHRLDSALRMQRLDRIAGQALAYPTFISHQRRTNRGLYAALCGELPSLQRGVSKMTEYARAGTRRCLPQLLADAGYRTAYLQAAPLAFMLKDQFMPKSGFDTVYGHEFFDGGYAESVWGVDDRAFFEQSLPLIESLRASEQPFFLTLLTVGTHHPTILPDDFEPDREFRFARAVSYADLAIGEFIDALTRAGVPEDTLVLISSDESRGLGGSRDTISNSLLQHWGFLVAMVPGESPQTLDQPYAQMDLSISILDYLGLADRGAHLFGRSVFRRYAAGRSLFFANVNLGFSGEFDPEGNLLFCADGSECRGFAVDDGRIFSPQRRPLEREADFALLHDIQRLSVGVLSGGIRPQSFELMVAPEFTVAQPTKQLIHGGQNIDLREGQWLEVEIDMTATGTSGQTVQLSHVLSGGSRKIKVFPLTVGTGQKLRLHYTFAPESAMTDVKCRTLASTRRDDPVKLTFRTARMTLHTLGMRPVAGLHVSVRERVDEAAD